MREIKFRAWNKKWNCMLRVRAMTFNNNETIHPTEVYAVMTLDQDGRFEDNNYPDDIILMQFTGLLDKNGKEIFEGDIIFFRTSQTQHFKGIIKWDDAHFFSDVFYEKRLPFGMNTKEHEHYWLKGNYQGYRFSSDLFDMEILGNIYKNPELLKEKK